MQAHAISTFPPDKTARTAASALASSHSSRETPPSRRRSSRYLKIENTQLRTSPNYAMSSHRLSHAVVAIPHLNTSEVTSRAWRWPSSVREMCIMKKEAAEKLVPASPAHSPVAQPCERSTANSEPSPSSLRIKTRSGHFFVMSRGANRRRHRVADA